MTTQVPIIAHLQNDKKKFKVPVDCTPSDLKGIISEKFGGIVAPQNLIVVCRTKKIEGSYTIVSLLNEFPDLKGRAIAITCAVKVKGNRGSGVPVIAHLQNNKKKFKVPVDCTPSDLKRIISEKFGGTVAPQNLIVVCRTKKLEGSYSIRSLLNEFPDLKGRAIAVTCAVKVKGGGCGIGYSHHNMDQIDGKSSINTDKEFATTAPKYRTWTPGLNIEGECKNLSCEANGKRVIDMKGMGNFEVAELYCDVKCPMCKKNLGLRNIKRFGFCACKFRTTTIDDNAIKKISNWIDVPSKPVFLKGSVGDKNYLKVIYDVKRSD